MRCIEFVKMLMNKEPKLEALLATEDRTADGVYRPDLDDPQLANPFAGSFWELGLLERDHWDEDIRTQAGKLANGKFV
jgi:nucleolar complex protein 3